MRNGKKKKTMRCCFERHISNGKRTTTASASISTSSFTVVSLIPSSSSSSPSSSPLSPAAAFCFLMIMCNLQITSCSNIVCVLLSFFFRVPTLHSTHSFIQQQTIAAVVRPSSIQQPLDHSFSFSSFFHCSSSHQPSFALYDAFFQSFPYSSVLFVWLLLLCFIAFVFATQILYVPSDDSDGTNSPSINNKYRTFWQHIKCVRS